MGDLCFNAITESFKELTMLQRLRLNINRNELSSNSILQALKQIAKLPNLEHLEIHAKKNLRRVEQKEQIRVANEELALKTKKIEL